MCSKHVSLQVKPQQIISIDMLFSSCYCDYQLLSKSLPMIAGHLLEYHTCAHVHSCQPPGATLSHEHTLLKQLPCDKAAIAMALTQASLWQCWVGTPAWMPFPISVYFPLYIPVSSQVEYVHLLPVPYSTLTVSKSLRIWSRLCITSCFPDDPYVHSSLRTHAVNAS